MNNTPDITQEILTREAVEFLKQRYFRLAASIPIQIMEPEDLYLITLLTDDPDFDCDIPMEDAPEINVLSRKGNVFTAEIKCNGPRNK